MPKKNRIKPDAEPSAIAPVRVQRSVGLLPDAANLIREDILWHRGRRGSSGKTPDFEVGFIEGMYQAHGLILKLMKQPKPLLNPAAARRTWRGF